MYVMFVYDLGYFFGCDIDDVDGFYVGLCVVFFV